MEDGKYLKLNDIGAYKAAFHLSNYIWDLVVLWSPVAQNTVGSQYVRAADSISANIAEGFGRWGKKDKVKFYRYRQGSRKECYDWNANAQHRNLITEEQYQHIFQELEKLGPSIGHLIKYTKEKLKE